MTDVSAILARRQVRRSVAPLASGEGGGLGGPGPAADAPVSGDDPRPPPWTAFDAVTVSPVPLWTPLTTVPVTHLSSDTATVSTPGAAPSIHFPPEIPVVLSPPFEDSWAALTTAVRDVQRAIVSCSVPTQVTIAGHGYQVDAEVCLDAAGMAITFSARGPFGLTVPPPTPLSSLARVVGDAVSPALTLSLSDGYAFVAHSLSVCV